MSGDHGCRCHATNLKQICLKHWATAAVNRNILRIWRPQPSEQFENLNHKKLDPCDPEGNGSTRHTNNLTIKLPLPSPFSPHSLSRGKYSVRANGCQALLYDPGNRLSCLAGCAGSVSEEAPKGAVTLRPKKGAPRKPKGVMFRKKHLYVCGLSSRATSSVCE